MQYVLALIVPLALILIILLSQNKNKVIKDAHLLFFSLLGIAFIFSIILNILVVYGYINNHNNLLFSTILIIHIYFEGSIICAFAIYFLIYLNLEMKKFKKTAFLITIPYLLYFVVMSIVFIIYHNQSNIIEDIYYITSNILVIFYTIENVFIIKKAQIKNTIIFFGVGVMIILISTFTMVSFYLFSHSVHYIQRVVFTMIGTTIYLLIYLYWQNKRILVNSKTKLPNRRMFFDSLAQIYKNKISKKVFFISLLNYKTINNKFDQIEGDAFIRAIARFFCENYSEVYHYSEDEFALIIDEKNDIEEIIDQFETRFENTWNENNMEIKMDYIVVILDLLIDAKDREDAILLIEGMLHINKNSIDKIITCDNKIREAFYRKNFVHEILRRAVDRNEVLIYYQPIYSLEKKIFIGAEALSRIKHNGQIISPGEFIPIAEETGLIIELDMLVFEHTLQFIKKLEDKGIKIEAISINFSPIQFLQEDIVDRIANLIFEYQINPRQIAIEMTESVFLADYELPRKTMFALDKLGIRFYLDDFGVGFSNFSSIINLPFDLIKIDRSLVVEAAKNDIGNRVLKSICKSLNDNGLRILIEGVETKEQLNIVSNIGDFNIQGYYYAYPIPENEALDFLVKGGSK